MFQLTFSDQSMNEVNALDHVSQLELMEKLSSLTSEVLSDKNSDVGRLVATESAFTECGLETLGFTLSTGTKHCTATTF